MDVVTHDKVEDLNETWKNKCEGKDSSGNNTALNWETSKAGKFFGSIFGAGANAAAAYFGIIEELMVWINFFRFWF